jgi:predicted nucleic acid-binding protein
MTLLVADTSSLVSLGCTEHYDSSALSLLFDGFDVVVPQAVADEIETLASYDHDHRQPAQAVDNALDTARTAPQVDISESVPPLDLGERAAIELANDEQTQYLLCDEFTNLTLIASALDETELLTTPALITAFVDAGVFAKVDAQTQLSEVAAMRSWDNNSYYQRARRVLDQL